MLKSFVILVVLLGALGLVSACSQRGIKALKDKVPPLKLEEFFEGETIAYGIFEDRFGNLRRQFRVNITGTVDGDTLTLDEDFLYDDGERAQRIWTVTNLGADADGLIRYKGSAEDVIGEATGSIAGNALNWKYNIDLKTDSGSMRVHFNDWIYQQDERVAINRAYVSKFGVSIGSVTLVFLRGEAARVLGPLDLETWQTP